MASVRYSTIGLPQSAQKHKAGEHIGLVHVLGRPALMSAHVPNNIPKLLRDERLMGVL